MAISHRLLADRMARHLTVFGNRFGNCHRHLFRRADVVVARLSVLIYTLSRGGTMFFPGDNFQNTLQVFEEYRVQCLVGSPGGYENLLRWYETYPAYQSDIEVMFCGGDVLSRSLSERLRARICSHLVTAYGSTEASMSATAHAHEIAHVPRAVGFVTPGVTVQVVDASGTILPPGEEGAVRIRSAYAVDGYFGNPDATAEVFRNGWFYPGDIGTLSADNLLVVSGREQTVLNSAATRSTRRRSRRCSGSSTASSRRAHSAVPNELGISEICAVVVSREGIDEQMLRAHCEALLPRTFVPARFLRADRLPRNEMGKIDRRQLAAIAAEAARH